MMTSLLHTQELRPRSAVAKALWLVHDHDSGPHLTGRVVCFTCWAAANYTNGPDALREARLDIALEFRVDHRDHDLEVIECWLPHDAMRFDHQQMNRRLDRWLRRRTTV